MLTNEDDSVNEQAPLDLTDWDDDAYAAFAEEPDIDEDSSQYVPPAQDIERMLSVLAAELSADEEVDAIGSPEALGPFEPDLPATKEIRPAKLGVIENRELAEAFLQDASRDRDA